MLNFCGLKKPGPHGHCRYLGGRIVGTWVRPEHVLTSLSGSTRQWILLTFENALFVYCYCGYKGLSS